MIEYAIVVNDVVINRIVCDDGMEGQNFAEDIALTMDGEAVYNDNAQIGFVRIENGNFVVPPISPILDFDKLKNIMLNQIENIAEELIYQGVEFNGIQIPLTKKILTRINGINSNNTRAKVIKINKSTIVDYSQQEKSDLQDMIELKVETVESEEIRLTLLINSAISLEELTGIDLSFID